MYSSASLSLASWALFGRHLPVAGGLVNIGLCSAALEIMESYAYHGRQVALICGLELIFKSGFMVLFQDGVAVIVHYSQHKDIAVLSYSGDIPKLHTLFDVFKEIRVSLLTGLKVLFKQLLRFSRAGLFRAAALFFQGVK